MRRAVGRDQAFAQDGSELLQVVRALGERVRVQENLASVPGVQDHHAGRRAWPEHEHLPKALAERGDVRERAHPDLRVQDIAENRRGRGAGQVPHLRQAREEVQEYAAQHHGHDGHEDHHFGAARVLPAARAAPQAFGVLWGATTATWRARHTPWKRGFAPLLAYCPGVAGCHWRPQVF
eukprot:scaffold2771_cov252-Pinguiococcus_pyrenoidosus.AAC.27